MKKRKYLIIFIFFLIFIGAYSNQKGFWSGNANEYSNTNNETLTPAKEIRATLIISYAEDEVVIHETQTIEGDNVFNLLQTVTANENIDLKVEEYDFGTLVESINGVENSTEMSWIYFLNDQSGDVAADQKIIGNGDTVEWKYISHTGI